MIEQTLVLIKPDGVERGLIGEVIKRFEQRGLKIIGLKMVKAEKSFAEKHYTEDIAIRHGKPVRDSLINFITRNPVIAMVIQGIKAVEVVRKIVGSTFPGEADIGTIRGDYCHASKEYVKSKQQGANIVHASANKEDAEHELALWFSVNEIYDYKFAIEKHVFDPED